MADFYSWDKDTLVRFTEEATAKLQRQEQEIVQLRDDFKTVQLAWRIAVSRESRTSLVDCIATQNVLQCNAANATVKP